MSDQSRSIGTETEYGISTPSAPTLSPIMTSTHLVLAYAAKDPLTGVPQTPTQGRARWDYAGESPLDDARGFSLKRYHQPPIVDPNAIGVAQTITPAGARLYVDHAHPEYSSPETTTAHDALRYDLAGDHVVAAAITALNAATAAGHSFVAHQQPCPPVRCYRHNVDGKGASFGYHENYTYRRSTNFADLAANLIPHFVTRPIYAGAGRVGLGVRSERAGFQLSQRADYIEQVISLETTLNRGIINTRDEPHADPDKWGRLHVIVGDANQSQLATLLKLGTTALILDAIEAGIDFSDLTLADPVAALHTVSRDLQLTTPLARTSGAPLTAIEIQRQYLQRAAAVATTESHTDIVQRWDAILDQLADDPRSTIGLLDWSTKLHLCQRYLHQGASFADAKLAALDLQYADIDPQRSIYHALVRRGVMHTILDDATIAAAATLAPATTRAAVRSLLCSRFPAAVTAVNWDRLTLQHDGQQVTVAMPDPTQPTGADLAPLIANQTATLSAAIAHISTLPGVIVEHSNSGH
ncbi:depupylase/deamidase Dop [Corynebacterium choanae]|uniref:Pup deamidase/depupylase n=1 Tax=Corynebacterium choanae TaxID=1862358 RepID=A0A3G6J9K3_9CORY|nr:depupylase/deamidase Dop [Corynebacterium choanae]AZA13568.1 Pup deamidase/depupylase [Corynebacterium choanae]